MSTWVHDLDPFLVQFGESFGIRWYGLAYLTGFFAGAWLMTFIAKRGRGTLRPDLITDFITYVVIGTMVGGRLGYALFYAPDLLTDFSMQFPFWGVLRVWEGGMASHGGMVGVILAAVVFARRHEVDWRHLSDLTVLGGSIGIFLGRVANFINGELFGREAGPGLPWAVKFPGEVYLWLKSDMEARVSGAAPAMSKMTEAVKALGVDMASWENALRTIRAPGVRGQMHGYIDQVLLAIQNGNEAVKNALAPELLARHPSQLYEAVLEGLLLLVVCLWFWRKPRKPGVVGSLWLTIYAVVRIIAEHFRNPDAHIGYGLFGLTRGQWLSIAMLFVSIGLLIWTSRRNVPAIAGWGPEAQKLRDSSPLPFQGLTKKAV